MAEQRIVDAQIGSEGGTEERRRQHHAEQRGSRDQVEDGANDLDHADQQQILRRPSDGR